MKYPDHLERLMQTFRRLPGVGSKSAERFCFELLRWPEAKRQELIRLIAELPQKLSSCQACGSLIEEPGCYFCNSGARDQERLCLVATPKDVYLIEQTGQFKGLYHVLGGLLSPLAGRASLALDPLKNRIQDLGIKELIIAFDGTLEGDATAFYVKEQFKELGLTISRLAFGMPAGSLLEFTDGGSLAQALAYRRSL